MQEMAPLRTRNVSSVLVIYLPLSGQRARRRTGIAGKMHASRCGVSQEISSKSDLISNVSLKLIQIQSGTKYQNWHVRYVQTAVNWH